MRIRAMQEMMEEDAKAMESLIRQLNDAEEVYKARTEELEDLCEIHLLAAPLLLNPVHDAIVSPPFCFVALSV